MFAVDLAATAPDPDVEPESVTLKSQASH